MKYNKLFFLAITLTVLASACGGDKTGKSEVDDILDQQVEEKAPISNETIKGMLSSIPSPVEISILIQESGGKYNKDILNPVENKNEYNTAVKRALNLGVYGTDLGYTNIFGKAQDGLNYLDAVRTMADGINIGQFFDFEIIKRLASNNNNIDSLLLITNSNFQKINSYLQENNRSKFSLLIISGGWLEGLHLMLEVYQNGKNEKLKEKIGEQKVVLDQLAVLLEFYKDDEQIGKYAKEMLKLKSLYDQIKITTEYQESVMEIVDGIPMLVQKSTTTVFVSDEQLQDIYQQVGLLRNKIIKN